MCTNFKCKTAADGTVVVGRTLEFPDMLPTALVALASDFQGKGTGQDKAMTWTSKYGIVGVDAFSNPQWLMDGMNTEGLSAHLLYMPGHCTYQPYKGDGTDLSEVDVIAFLLGTCATVAEVKTATAGINVYGFDPGMGFAPPSHFLLHDAAASVAIEFHPEGISIVDNPVSVGTNSPYLDWHLTNVNNYVGVGPTNPAGIEISGVKFAPEGVGAGWRGLPGDSTPPSRFLRVLAMATSVDEPADSHEAEMTTLHILNNFDIPPGYVREPGPGGKLVDEVTVWVSICNLTAKRYAYRTFGDPEVFVVDLAKTDFTTTRSKPLPTDGEFTAVTL